MAAASLLFTWSRLFVGMDLKDESYYVVLPWRWVLGERPFAHEQTLFQMPALVEYPFLKLFGLLRGNDPTGVVLYARHLYLLLMIGVAVAAFLLLRRLVRWQLALVIACASMTYVFWATPQLSYDTMALAFLTLGVVFGAWVTVLGKGRGYALASGAAFGLAVVAYPTLLFVMPFFAVLLVLAHGRRATAVLAQGAFADPPDPGGPPTGHSAWRALSAWAAGGALVLVPIGALLVSFGLGNVKRSWQSTVAGAHSVGQLGGASKAVAVAHGIWSFVTWQPFVLALALLIYLLYRHWPRLGRALLAGIPVMLWAAAQHIFLDAAGYVLAYALLAPYLFLLVPREKRETGAKLLIWAWASALVAGVMTSYTSAVGYVNSVVGLAPAVIVSGLFLAWALEAVTTPETAVGARRGRVPWLALVVLVAVVGVTISFQFEFQQHEVPYSALTSRFDSGPWWGIKVTPERRAEVDSLAAGLRATTRPGDKLLILQVTPGYYLFWNGPDASYAYLADTVAGAELSPAEIAYLRDNNMVPDIVVNLTRTAGPTPAELAAGSAGLGYPAVLVRPGYVIYRKPPGETTAQALARLPKR